MAVHIIVKSAIAHLAMPYILHALGPFLRARFKLHRGSDYDIVSALSKYGIPQQELPFGQVATPLAVAPQPLDKGIKSAWLEAGAKTKTACHARGYIGIAFEA
jgi:hypothetical protein